MTTADIENRTEAKPGSKTDRGAAFFDTSDLLSDLKQRAIKGGMATFGGQFLSKFIQIGGTVVLARLLSPRDFGLVAMISVVTGFVVLFKDLGLATATVQKDKITHAQISNLFWVNAAMGIMMALGVMALAPAVAWFYEEPRLVWLTVALAAGLFPSSLITQHAALLRRQMKFGAIAAADILSAFAGITAGVIAALAGAGVWSLVCWHVVGYCVVTVVLWLSCPWRPGPPSRGTDVRGMLAFGGNLTGFNILNYVATKLDSILIGKFSGATGLGFYSRATNLLMRPLRELDLPFSNVAIPAMSRLVEDPERYRRVYFRILHKIAFLAIPLVAFLIATADWIIRLLLGPQWDFAARLFAILGFAGLVIPVLRPVGWLFASQGRTREMFHWGVFDGSVKVLSVLVGLIWGVVGVAVAVAVRYYVMMPACLWYVCRRGPVRLRDYIPTLAFSGLLATVTLGGVYLWRQWSGIASPFWGTMSSFIVTAFCAMLVFVSFPMGRDFLKDVLTMASEPVRLSAGKIRNWVRNRQNR